MSVRLVLVPLIRNAKNARVPKYIYGAGVAASISPFGLHDFGLVLVAPNPALATALAGAADVFIFPANLRTNPDAATLSDAVVKFESTGVPASDFTVGNTFREIAKRAFLLSRFYQRAHGATISKLLGGGVTLDTAFSALPAALQTKIVHVAATLQLDTSGVKGSATLRQILIGAASGLAAKPNANAYAPVDRVGSA